VLYLHRADRADGLAGALAGLLAEAPADPFAPEVVSVPTRGMERWLSQRVSSALGSSPDRGDGICANVEFPFPHRLLSEAVAAASGVDPSDDPWRPDRATWTLLEVVQDGLSENWMAVLAAYLGGDGDPPDPQRAARRLTTVRHISSLFDRYALHRPGMVEAWRRGQDTDADGQPLAPEYSWQAELWRRLRKRLALPGPAERRAGACRRLTEDADAVDLPERLSLFGLTRLPAGHREVIRALAERRDVHLFLLHPSAALWEALALAPANGDHNPRRAADRSSGLAANRLLASWGRDAREMQLVLTQGTPGTWDDEAAPPSPGPPTLLGRLQEDIRQNRAAPGPPLGGQADERLLLDPSDESLVVHACRARQVEVLRDAILHALADDPTLEPRDVIVMCPDIETYAPLIQATFGAGETASEEAGADALQPVPDELRPVDLRVRLADRSLRQTNPILGVVAELLELAEQRVTASQVLDLADRAPVRRRFRLDDDDLARLQAWIAQAGIRWGLDAQHRERFKLGAVPGGTWDAGLERLLLGVTMNEDGQRLFGGVLPLDDVDSRSIELAGRLAELLERLRVALDALAETQTLDAWAQALGEAADSLTDAPPRERWQRAELQRLLDEMTDEAGGEPSTPLAAPEIQAYLGERLAGRPTRANFRTGHLTVCTLMPMRSVPHRVVCLLGLDDGAFPRKTPRDGDDLMLAEPHVGERDPRSEDRQLLLDALLAAEERLIVTYSGNDERTNSLRPPAVPVGELLDAVDATVRIDQSPPTPARDQVLIQHPLQPFDPRNFESDALTGGRVWSFDRVTLEGARALSGPRQPRPEFLSDPLPPRPGSVVELDDLVRFVEHPTRAFLRQRLGISLGRGVEEIADGLPVELDGLERWGVGQRLLEALLAGIDGGQAIKAEVARGMLPPGRLGIPVVEGVFPIAEAIAQEARRVAPGGLTGEPVDVGLRLADGRRLSGTVSGVSGQVLLSATYSRVAAKHRLAAWVRLLALTASRPDGEYTAMTVGRAQGTDVRVARVPALGEEARQRQERARVELERLIDLYDRGMCEPLPIFCATSAAYADAARRGRAPFEAAEREWLTTFGYDREDREPEHQYTLGGVRPLAELVELAPREDEGGPGWEQDEGSRLGRLALRLWEGLLSREEVSAR
jgi:exodeoxyribonuclease V gamma subunit